MASKPALYNLRISAYGGDTHQIRRQISAHRGKSWNQTVILQTDQKHWHSCCCLHCWNKIFIIKPLYLITEQLTFEVIAQKYLNLGELQVWGMQMDWPEAAPVQRGSWGWKGCRPEHHRINQAQEKQLQQHHRKWMRLALESRQRRPWSQTWNRPIPFHQTC